MYMYFSHPHSHFALQYIISGDDSVEFSWRISDPFKQYKAVLIDSTTNNQTTYAIKQFARSRHSQSGYTISNLKVQYLGSPSRYFILSLFDDEFISIICKSMTTPNSLFYPVDLALRPFLKNHLIRIS